MSVVPNLTTILGRVRWKIADAVDGDGGFTDAEISMALADSTAGGTEDGAVCVLLRHLLVSRARRASLFAEPQPGAAVRDDATAIEAIRAALAMYGGDAPRIPRARFGSLGAHPSDGDAYPTTLYRGCR